MINGTQRILACCTALAAVLTLPKGGCLPVLGSQVGPQGDHAAEFTYSAPLGRPSAVAGGGGPPSLASSPRCGSLICLCIHDPRPAGTRHSTQCELSQSPIAQTWTTRPDAPGNPGGDEEYPAYARLRVALARSLWTYTRIPQWSEAVAAS